MMQDVDPTAFAHVSFCLMPKAPVPVIDAGSTYACVLQNLFSCLLHISTWLLDLLSALTV